MTDTDTRRNENLHTLSELEQAGNKTISINETIGKLFMKRGQIYTWYVHRIYKEQMYWYPINAKSYA